MAALASLALLALAVPQIGWPRGETELMSRGSIERELNADAVRAPMAIPSKPHFVCL